MINNVGRFLHRHGVHLYTKPLGIIEKNVYYIEGDHYVTSESKDKIYRKVKCAYCNKRRLKWIETRVTRYGY